VIGFKYTPSPMVPAARRNAEIFLSFSPEGTEEQLQVIIFFYSVVLETCSGRSITVDPDARDASLPTSLGGGAAGERSSGVGIACSHSRVDRLEKIITKQKPASQIARASTGATSASMIYVKNARRSNARGP